MTSLMIRKCYETGTFHSFTADGDSGCLEASVRIVYCAAFYFHANSSKTKVTCSWFKFTTEPTLYTLSARIQVMSAYSELGPVNSDSIFGQFGPQLW